MQEAAGLFAPLTEGERADALRTLLEDERLQTMTKIGRYRVIAVEPLVLKPPEPMAGRRLVRVVIYDHSEDRCVDGCVDLEKGVTFHVSHSTSQPMLSVEEESDAARAAMEDDRVLRALQPGGRPLGVMHYWSRRPSDLSYRRRSAAVILGTEGAPPTLVAVVDLIDLTVAEVVPASRW